MSNEYALPEQLAEMEGKTFKDPDHDRDIKILGVYGYTTFFALLEWDDTKQTFQVPVFNLQPQLPKPEL